MRTEYYSSFDEACDRADANRGRLRIVADGARAPETPRRFQLVPFGQLSPGTSSSYLVKGLIPRVGIAAVWGPPKCGKSFWAFDLALHSALGRECRLLRIRGSGGLQGSRRCLPATSQHFARCRSPVFPYADAPRPSERSH